MERFVNRFHLELFLSWLVVNKYHLKDDINKIDTVVELVDKFLNFYFNDYIKKMEKC